MFRAQMFLKGLQDRASILPRLAECLVGEQESYLKREREEDLLPMTQALLASFLQVHESTVSRAVAEKFVQLPSGRIVPLSFFFDRALSVRKLVANVVASEDPAAPYSDQEISDILRRQGVTLARRTVMKYREEMNILSSRQRARISG
jgi:RNA polymerase sigma-54 factor